MEINQADTSRAVHPDVVGKEPPTQFFLNIFVYVFFLTKPLILFVSLSFPHPLPHSPLQSESTETLSWSADENILSKLFLSVRKFTKQIHDWQELTRVQADVSWEGAHRHTSLMVRKLGQNRPLKNRQEVFQGWKVMCHVWVQSQSWAWGKHWWNTVKLALWCEDFLF